MDIFETIFGLKEKEVKRNCIICPSNDASLFIKPALKGAKGLIYSAQNIKNATIISSKNNFLIGDCILYLKETSCENIFLFGSSAGIDKAIGDCLLIQKSFSLESFSKMLTGETEFDCFFADKSLFEGFEGLTKGKPVTPADSACASSLLLEKDYLDWAKINNVKCFDMESSIIYSSARKIGRKALAIFYVTDLAGKNPFYTRLLESEKKKLLLSRKMLSGLLLDYIENDLS